MTIEQMRQALQELQRQSAYNSDPPHLYTYYFDAIQALYRLEAQVSHVEATRYDWSTL